MLIKIFCGLILVQQTGKCLASRKQNSHNVADHGFVNAAGPYFACNDWETLEEKAVQFGLEKKQSIMGSRDSPMWRLLTDRLNHLGC